MVPEEEAPQEDDLDGNAMVEDEESFHSDAGVSSTACQGHSHPKLPVSPSCTQQLLSTKDGRTPVGCP